MYSKQGFPVILILSGNADYLHQIPDTVFYKTEKSMVLISVFQFD